MPKRYFLMVYKPKDFKLSLLETLDAYDYFICPVNTLKALEDIFTGLRVNLLLLHEPALDKIYRKVHKRYPKTKLFVFTDHPHKDYHKKLRERGADELIILPASDGEIIKKIMRVFP